MIKEYLVSYETIHHSKLFIDYSYQRSLSKFKLKKIKDNFVPSAVTTIIVSERDNGLFAIVDGQHRFEAAKTKDFDYFRCEIHHNLTIQEEAELFYNINVNRGPVASGMQFKALLEAENEDAIKINFIIQSYGFELLHKSGASTAIDNKFTCASELQKIYRISHNHFEQVIFIMREVWNGKKESLRYQLIGAISNFLKKYKEEISVSRLINVLSKNSLNDIFSNSKTRVKMDGLYLTDAVEVEIKKLYNKCLVKKLK
jgi:hypothetical protein